MRQYRSVVELKDGHSRGWHRTLKGRIRSGHAPRMPWAGRGILRRCTRSRWTARRPQPPRTRPAILFCGRRRVTTDNSWSLWMEPRPTHWQEPIASKFSSTVLARPGNRQNSAPTVRSGACITRCRRLVPITRPLPIRPDSMRSTFGHTTAPETCSRAMRCRGVDQIAPTTTLTAPTDINDATRIVQQLAIGGTITETGAVQSGIASNDIAFTRQTVADDCPIRRCCSRSIIRSR